MSQRIAQLEKQIERVREDLQELERKYEIAKEKMLANPSQENRSRHHAAQLRVQEFRSTEATFQAALCKARAEWEAAAPRREEAKKRIPAAEKLIEKRTKAAIEVDKALDALKTACAAWHEVDQQFTANAREFYRAVNTRGNAAVRDYITSTNGSRHIAEAVARESVVAKQITIGDTKDHSNPKRPILSAKEFSHRLGHKMLDRMRWFAGLEGLYEK